MSSNSVCNYTRDKQIGLSLCGRPIFHSYDYRLNWTPLSPITITNLPFDFISDDCIWPGAPDPYFPNKRSWVYRHCTCPALVYVGYMA